MEWLIKRLKISKIFADFQTLCTCQDNFNITPKKPYITHPCDPQLKLFFGYDELHLFKSFANHIRDDTCMLPDGSLFSIQEFQDLLDKRGSSSEFTLGQHLHQKQLSAKGQNRQTVSHVVNMVSHETADLIDHFHPFDPDDLENTENDKWHKLSRCCRIMADMHLVMTSNRDEPSSKNKLHSPLGLSACFTSG